LVKSSVLVWIDEIVDLRIFGLQHEWERSPVWELRVLLLLLALRLPEGWCLALLYGLAVLMEDQV